MRQVLKKKIWGKDQLNSDHKGVMETCIFLGLGNLKEALLIIAKKEVSKKDDFYLFNLVKFFAL